MRDKWVIVLNYLLEMEAIKDERITYVRGACDRFFDEKGNFHLELFGVFGQNNA